MCRSMNDHCSKAIWFLLFVLVGTGSIKAESRWIRQVSGNRGVIIFVHGLTGDATTTWTSSSGKYWPEMLTHDLAFDGQDIYVYEYVSPKMTGALSLSQLTNEMYVRLDDAGVLQHDQLTFISHSMGGILTRAFILRYQKTVASKIRMLLFLATPTNGSEIAKLGRFSFNPQVKTLIPNDDPDSYLNTLQDDWNGANLGIKSFCAYEIRPLLLGQIIVDKSSAVTLCGQQWEPIDADHKTIAKPDDTNSLSYVFFRDAFRNTSPPAQPRIATKPVRVPEQQPHTERNSSPPTTDIVPKPTPPTSAPSIRFGDDPDAFKKATNKQIAQWSIEEADKIKRLAENYYGPPLSPKANEYFFRNHLKKCCWDDLICLHSELMARLGPRGKDSEEIEIWTTLMAGGIDRTGTLFIKSYSPYFRKLGELLLRDGAQPILADVPFEVVEVKPDSSLYSQALLISLKPQKPLPVGSYLIVEFADLVNQPKSDLENASYLDEDEQEVLLNDFLPKAEVGRRLVWRLGQPLTQATTANHILVENIHIQLRLVSVKALVN